MFIMSIFFSVIGEREWRVFLDHFVNIVTFEWENLARMFWEVSGYISQNKFIEISKSFLHSHTHHFLKFPNLEGLKGTFQVNDDLSYLTLS